MNCEVISQELSTFSACLLSTPSRHTELSEIDMTKALSEMFASAQAPCINWEGEPAYAIYELTPAPGGLVVEFLAAAESPVQGLTVKASGGALEINGVEASEMLLWHDTAPAKVSVRVKPQQGKRVTLKIWNIWRGTLGGTGITQAWLGNAGMRIHREGKELLLRCSDGEGPIDFSDPEARVMID